MIYIDVGHGSVRPTLGGHSPPATAEGTLARASLSNPIIPESYLLGVKEKRDGGQWNMPSAPDHRAGSGRGDGSPLP